jgi:hypothetical protein
MNILFGHDTADAGEVRVADEAERLVAPPPGRLRAPAGSTCVHPRAAVGPSCQRQASPFVIRK